jgi:tight adherence protein B
MLGAIIFFFALMLIELSIYAYRIFMHPDRAEVRRRLLQTIDESDENTTTNIYRQTKLSEVPFIHAALSRVPGVERVQLILYQANVKFSLGFFFLISMIVGSAGMLATYMLMANALLSIVLSVFLASLPAIYVRSQKRQRTAKFEKQLPEALSLIARALRAGHAFTSGMNLAAEEFSDPLGTEFERTLEEINFGQSVAAALKNMVQRVDCPDLNFFVVSVILQRETGGNLAEIIEGLAHLIRQRFKFKGKLRVLTAEGRLSAIVLYVLPILLAAFLFTFHPDVVAPLHEDPIGRAISGITLGLMALGYIMIKRIIKVEV